MTVLLEHGVGRAWAGANLGGVLCGSSKKSYNPLQKQSPKKAHLALIGRDLEFCSNYGLRAVLRAQPEHSRTSAGLPVKA